MNPSSPIASLLVALSVLAPVACSSAPSAPSTMSTTSAEPVTNVPQTPLIKNQAIGNCWIYATGSWAESLHKIAGSPDFNTSESYWTYLDWFQKITGGQSTTSISEGGNFSDSSAIIQRYGIMAEPDFIPGDVVADETSSAQAQAETAINASLKSGALSTADARSNPATVRQELDKAFGLSAAVTSMLTRVFGASLANGFDAGADATGTTIIAPTSFAVSYTSGPGTAAQPRTLLDATNDWQTVRYDSRDHRRFENRFQLALQDEQPVVMSWFVDFNYMDSQGRFIVDPAHPKTPGAGGGHMVVMKDYQVESVPGFGTLPAGTLVTDPAAFKAALDPSATIDFIRIKNSWGTQPPDLAAMPGYFDLYTNYLEGKIAQCDENNTLPDGGVDMTHCPKAIPFEDVTLPPGY